MTTDEIMELVDAFGVSCAHTSDGKFSANRDAQVFRANIANALSKLADRTQSAQAVAQPAVEPVAQGLSDEQKDKLRRRLAIIFMQINCIEHKYGTGGARYETVQEQLNAIVKDHGLKPLPSFEMSLPSTWVKNGVIVEPRDARSPYFSPAPAPNALDALTQAARDVLDERQRQIDAEGYEPEADDFYEQGELASAAATYALLATGADGWRVDDHWPWAMHSLKKGDPRRMLVKSAALNLAEIERIDRAAQSAHGG